MNRLLNELAMICQQELWAEKWLLAPTLRVGHQWLDAMALEGHPAFNVRVKTLLSVAIELIAPWMAEQQLELITSTQGLLLANRLLHRPHANPLRYLGRVEPTSGLAEAVLASLESLRRAGVSANDLRIGHFEVGAKASDLRVLLGEYQAELENRRLIDESDALRIAADRLATAPGLLPPNVVVVAPVDLAKPGLERRFLDAFDGSRIRTLDGDQPYVRKTLTDASSPEIKYQADTDLARLSWLLSPQDAPPPVQDGTVRMVRAVGEINEVRHVLRCCQAEGIPFDQVELLHTDTNTYLPLIYEVLASLDFSHDGNQLGLPVTFAEGLPLRYARPARGLLQWLDWMAQDFPQVQLVRMLREGLLELPQATDTTPGLERSARRLQSLGIGFGRSRYLAQIKQELEAARQQHNDLHAEDEEDDEERALQRGRAARKVAELELLSRVCQTLIELSPPADATAPQLLEAALRFLETCVSCINEFDRFARQKLQQEIAALRTWLTDLPEAGFDPHAWLISLVHSTRVLGSGPRPGCLHVAHALSGGHSGRPQTFIVGLDDTRFPGSGLQDPLVLDEERTRLSDALPTARGQLVENTREFARLLARVRGKLVLSYASHSIADGRALFPSTVLLTCFRILAGQPAGDQTDLQNWLPPAVSFAPQNGEEALHEGEWWLWRLCGDQGVMNCHQAVGQAYPHLARGQTAEDERESERFTRFDGQVPAAGVDLDPCQPDRVISANQLQTIGRCPLAYFFRYGLRLEPPDEIGVATDTWLNPLAAGGLLHRVFERFVRELADQGHAPQFDRDQPRLRQILDEEIKQHQEESPPSSQSVFDRQCKEFVATTEIFLREEERYCQQNQAVPLYLEASLGLEPEGHASAFDTPDPIPISIARGRQIQVRGRIDRVDRLGDRRSRDFAIWDYKTGSAFGYDRSDPHRQGRTIQPFLYAQIVTHQLKKVHGAAAQVRSFGFFFPSPRGQGERLVWATEDLAEGKTIVDQLARLIRTGSFLATDNADDCRFCDFARICGDAATVVQRSERKLGEDANRELASFRALRPRG